VVTKKKTLPSKKRRNISLTNKNHMPPSRRLRHDASEDIDIASYDRSRIKNQKPSYKYNIDRKKYSSEHSKYGTTLENYKSYSADHTRSTVPSLYNKANNIKYKDNPRRQTENRHHKMLTRDGKPIEHRSRVHNRNSSSPNKDSEALIMAGDSLMFRLKFVPEATKIELAQQLELENIIQTMIDDNSLSVTLYGFADWHRRHGLRFTHEVSHGRVMAVKEYMREKGIRPHRIITEVVGLDLQPGVSRDRVDIVANH
jgi:outer membrane protein OmpA-like peptidoglycan-associated protein